VRKIIGQRTRREFSIGDRVRVLLESVDAVERKLQFSLVEPVRAAAGRKRRK
jgi:ribonuclease R